MRIMANISWLMVVILSIFINSCDNNKNLGSQTVITVKEEDGMSLLKGQSISYTVNMTTEFEGSPLPYDVEKNHSNDGKIYNLDPNVPITRSVDVILSQDDGKPNITITPHNDTNRVDGKRLHRLKNKFSTDGENLIVYRNDGIQTKKPFNKLMKADVEKRLEEKLGGETKALKMKNFFHDILVKKENFLEKAKDVFDGVEKISGNKYILSKITTDGIKQMDFDGDQNLITGERMIKDGAVISEAIYEYSEISGKTFKTKSIRILTMPVTVGNPTKIKTTQEITNVSFN